MYVRVLAPGETLTTRRPAVPHDPDNALQYLMMGWVVLVVKDGTVVAMSEEPFDDEPTAHAGG